MTQSLPINNHPSHMELANRAYKLGEQSAELGIPRENNPYIRININLMQEWDTGYTSIRTRNTFNLMFETALT